MRSVVGFVVLIILLAGCGSRGGLTGHRAVLTGHAGPVWSVAFSPNGRIVASASDDKTVRLWDVRSSNELGSPLNGHTGSVNSVAFSPNGRIVASASDDKTIRLWDVRSHRQIGQPLRGHKAGVEAVAFSPDGRLLVSGGDDGTIRFWDVRTHTQLARPVRIDRGVEAVVFSPDGRVVASGSVDDSIQLWNARTHREVPGNQQSGGMAMPDIIDALAFTPDGQVLASAMVGAVVLWDVRTQKRLRKLAVGGEVLAISPDGRILATGGALDPNSTYGASDSIVLWDLRAQKRLGKPLTGHTDNVRSLAFSADGCTLASASIDETIRLWPIAGSKCHHLTSGLAAGASADAWARAANRICTATLIFRPFPRHATLAQVLVTFEASERSIVRTIARHEAIRYPRSAADTKALNLERDGLKSDKTVVADLKQRSLPKFRRDVRALARISAQASRAFRAIGAPTCAGRVA